MSTSTLDENVSSARSQPQCLSKQGPIVFRCLLNPSIGGAETLPSADEGWLQEGQGSLDRQNPMTLRYNSMVELNMHDALLPFVGDDSRGSKALLSAAASCAMQDQTPCVGCYCTTVQYFMRAGETCTVYSSSCWAARLFMRLSPCFDSEDMTCFHNTFLKLATSCAWVDKGVGRGRPLRSALRPAMTSRSDIRTASAEQLE